MGNRNPYLLCLQLAAESLFAVAAHLRDATRGSHARLVLGPFRTFLEYQGFGSYRWTGINRSEPVPTRTQVLPWRFQFSSAPPVASCVKCFPVRSWKASARSRMK
jgi:hypothetical protein